MQMTVAELAEALGVEQVEASRAAGSATGAQASERTSGSFKQGCKIERVSSIGEAQPGSLVFAEDQAALKRALRSSASAVLLAPELALVIPPGQPPLDQPPSDLALLLSPQPRLAFARAALLLRPTQAPTGVHPQAFVADGVRLGLEISIGPFAVIETGAAIGDGSAIAAGVVVGAGVVIGSQCRIYPRVVLYPGTRLGDRVVVHAGAVLGSDGFGYVRDKTTGAYLQFPQQGVLILEDDVEVGANTTIDRGALAQTRIGRGVKLDNLVHIGHNVEVGANAVIAAQVGISGSSTIGTGVLLAGQVGIGDHAAVGEGVILGGQGGVLPHKTLRGPGELFWGTPAKPVKQYLRELASLTRLARRRSAASGEREEGS